MNKIKMPKYTEEELLIFYNNCGGYYNQKAFNILQKFLSQYNHKKYSDDINHPGYYLDSFNTISICYTSYATTPQQVIDFGNFLLQLKQNGHKVICCEFGTFEVSLKIPKDVKKQLIDELSKQKIEFDQKTLVEGKLEVKEKEDTIIETALKILKERGNTITVVKHE